jgi:glycosyltransferase involved in cell wall biosynthesis
MKPTLSYIIPLSGNRQTIYKTIKSIYSQKNEVEYEVVIVYNGSQLPLHTLSSYPGLRVIHTGQHSAAFARNRGAESAQGRYLVFLDSDIVLFAGWTQNALKSIKQGASIATSRITPIAKVNNYLLKYYAWYRKFITGRQYNFLEWRFPVLDSACFMIEKDTFWENDGFDESLKYQEDFDFGLKILNLKGRDAIKLMDHPGVRELYGRNPRWIPYFFNRFQKARYYRIVCKRWNIHDWRIFFSFRIIPPLKSIKFFPPYALELISFISGYLLGFFHSRQHHQQLRSVSNGMV